jgi:UDP-sulfoquinovose synthase
VRALILGVDGYLGWPTALRFSALGHDVIGVDNLGKRLWESEIGVTGLFPIPSLPNRARAWEDLTGRHIEVRVGDISQGDFLYRLVGEFQPDFVVHYAEQPSAPYSMLDRERCTETQRNNVVGNLNLLWAIKEQAPDCHLIKLGTMGEYGTPNIDIEEGYLEVTHNGRSDRVLYPKQPGSWYHLSKVHDSANIDFACRIWGLRATDLNQGVVYGTETPEIGGRAELRTNFHYDNVFGTVLNRFCVQAVAGWPLTVYGKGGQTRGFLNLLDTLACVNLAAENPAGRGEFRVFNQFTEQFSVLQLAELVREAAARRGIEVTINHVPNPRVEKEEHYYNAKHTGLLELGLQPNLLTLDVIDGMLSAVQAHRERIDLRSLGPMVAWRAEAVPA